MNLKKLLGSSSFTIINKHLMKQIGLEETFMLQYLLDLQENELGERFYQQQSRLSKEFGWSLRKIKTVMTRLKNLELIKVYRGGENNKNFFTINKDKIIQMITTPLDQSELAQNGLAQNGSTSEPDLNSPVSPIWAHKEHTNREQNNKNKIIIDNIDRQWTEEELIKVGLN